jgi:hypothetical protein
LHVAETYPKWILLPTLLSLDQTKDWWKMSITSSIFLFNVQML